MLTGSKRTRTQITMNWQEPMVVEPYVTGVSLHSHTSISEETLGFIHAMFVAFPVMKTVFDHYQKRSDKHGIKLDFERANWRPPLQPRRRGSTISPQGSRSSTRQKPPANSATKNTRRLALPSSPQPDRCRTASSNT